MLRFVLAPLFAQTPAAPEPPPASPIPWALAFLLSVAVLLVVCMPSRKA